MADIDSQSLLRVLELWQAAYSGDVPKLQELLADPTVRDMINHKMKSQRQHTALFFACYGSANAETIRLLLSAGADPFMRDDSGHLPLHLAAYTQDPELVAAFLEVPNMKAYRYDPATSTGQTPLHMLFVPDMGVTSSVKSKNADISRCLPFFLEVGQDPLGALHKRDNNGLSSLMLVKHYNHKAAFHPYVPARTFDILLRSVAVPSNIEELLKSGVSTPALEAATDNSEVFTVQRLRPA